MEWKNINEEQPNNSEVVAVIVDFGTVNESLHIARWIASENRFAIEFLGHEEVVYWCRLPELPEGAYVSDINDG